MNTSRSRKIAVPKARLDLTSADDMVDDGDQPQTQQTVAQGFGFQPPSAKSFEFGGSLNQAFNNANSGPSNNPFADGVYKSYHDQKSRDVAEVQQMLNHYAEPARPAQLYFAGPQAQGAQAPTATTAPFQPFPASSITSVRQWERECDEGFQLMQQQRDVDLAMDGSGEPDSGLAASGGGLVPPPPATAGQFDFSFDSHAIGGNTASNKFGAKKGKVTRTALTKGSNKNPFASYNKPLLPQPFPQPRPVTPPMVNDSGKRPNFTSPFTIRKRVCPNPTYNTEKRSSLRFDLRKDAARQMQSSARNATKTVARGSSPLHAHNSMLRRAIGHTGGLWGDAGILYTGFASTLVPPNATMPEPALTLPTPVPQLQLDIEATTEDSAPPAVEGSAAKMPATSPASVSDFFAKLDAIVNEAKGKSRDNGSTEDPVSEAAAKVPEPPVPSSPIGSPSFDDSIPTLSHTFTTTAPEQPSADPTSDPPSLNDSILSTDEDITAAAQEQSEEIGDITRISYLAAHESEEQGIQTSEIFTRGQGTQTSHVAITDQGTQTSPASLTRDQGIQTSPPQSPARKRGYEDDLDEYVDSEEEYLDSEEDSPPVPTQSAGILRFRKFVVPLLAQYGVNPDNVRGSVGIVAKFKLLDGQGRRWEGKGPKKRAKLDHDFGVLPWKVEDMDWEYQS